MHLICIEGLDGVGKESITNELYDYIQTCGFSVKKVSFPQYDTLPGKTIKTVLSGAYGDASKMHHSLIAPLYTIDRIGYFGCELENLKQYDFVILDRSYYSNFIYQASKLWYSIEPTSVTEENRVEALVDWCKLNYELELKETGLLNNVESIQVVYLQLSENDRRAQISTRDSQDTNESNYSYLELCRKFMSPESIAHINSILSKFVSPGDPFMGFYTGKSLNRFNVIHADNEWGVKEANRNLATTIFQSLITEVYSKLDNDLILFRNDTHRVQIHDRWREFLKYVEIPYLEASLNWQVRDVKHGKEIVVYTAIANCADPYSLTPMLEAKLQEIISEELEELVKNMKDMCNIIPIAHVI